MFHFLILASAMPYLRRVEEPEYRPGRIAIKAIGKRGEEPAVLWIKRVLS
jgi:hypothetical protein